MAKVKGNHGRLIFVDPNDLAALSSGYTYSDYSRWSDKGLDNIAWNPEDLNIDVDLQVVLPDRNDIVLELKGQDNSIFDVYVNDNSNGSNPIYQYISFFGGTDDKPLDATGKTNMLTTNYSDMNYNELKDGKQSNSECLGIESIDITFDAHFYPQVSIKFIDVHGYSLINPAEEERTGGEGGGARKDFKNVFRSLFHFPYPRFLLSIKGHYGDRVTFMLAPNEMKTNFNAGTGNFEVNVSFIGYTYGLYTDIPLDCLIAAPYALEDVVTEEQAENYGNNYGNYWSSRVAEGAFVDSEGNQLPTFLELRQRYSQMDTTYKENADTNGLVGKAKTQNAELLDKQGKLTTLKDLWNRFRNNTDFYETREEEENTLLLIRDNYEGSLINFEECGLAKVINFLSENPDLLEGFTVDNFKENAQSKMDDEQVSAFAVDVLCFVESDKYDDMCLSFYYGDFANKINNDLNRITDEMEALRPALEEEKLEVTSRLLGFYPSVENIYRMLFAHLDTFIHLMYSTIDDTKDRTIGSMGIADKVNQTDVAVMRRAEDKYLPPFPLFYQDSKNDNQKVTKKNEIVYPTKVSDTLYNMSEVRLIDKIVNGVQYVRNVTDWFNIDSGTETSEGRSSTDFIPIMMSDVFHYLNDTNPFDNLPAMKDDESIEKVLYLEMLRIIAAENFNTSYLIGSGNMKFWNVDAENYYLAHKSSTNVKKTIDAYIEDFSRKILTFQFNNNTNKKSLLGITAGESNLKSFPVYFTNIWAETADVLEHNASATEYIGGITDAEVHIWDKKSTEWEKISKIPEIIEKLYNFGDNDTQSKKKATLKAMVGDASSIFSISEKPNKLFTDVTEFYSEKWNDMRIYRLADNLSQTISNTKVTTSNIRLLSDNGKVVPNQSVMVNFIPYSSKYVDTTLYTPVKVGMQRVPKTNSENASYQKLVKQAMKKPEDYIFPLLKIYDNGKETTFYKELLSPEKFSDIISRAAKFVSCFPFDYDEVLEILLGNNIYGIFEMPKAIVLYIGALFYYYERGLSKKATDNTLLFKRIEVTDIYDENILPTNRGSYYVSTTENNNAIRIGTGEFKHFQNSDIKGTLNGKIRGPETSGSFKGEVMENDIIYRYYFAESNGYKDKIGDVYRKKRLLFDYFKKYFVNWANNEYKHSPLTKNDGVYEYTAEMKKEHIVSKCEAKYSGKIIFRFIHEYDKSKLFVCSTEASMKYGSPIEKYCKELYLATCMVYIPVPYNDGKKIECVDSTVFNCMVDKKKEVLKSFLTEVSKKYDGGSDTTGDTPENNTDQPKWNAVNVGDEYRLALYLTLKNLTDKWLTTYRSRDFMLSNYQEHREINNARFRKETENGNSQALYKRNEFDSFIFVDGFFNDIGNTYVCDIGSLIKTVDEHIRNGQNYSTFELMNEIAQKNKLLLLALPVYNNPYKGVNGLFSAFAPNNIYSEGGKNTFGMGNTYVCLYPNEPSNKLDPEDSIMTSYEPDGFDIIKDTDIVNGLTTDELFGGTEDGTEGGYPVPAFAVSYGKQNQMYFKSVTVNMDNPQVTDYSMANLFQIAGMGQDGNVSDPNMVGGNLFSIYSNRSYNCTVEMMGCANIMPLMYFQLNNIPMFRGAYMIFNVKHHIQPGAMSTSFTGVRMSTRTMPYNGAVTHPWLNGNLGYSGAFGGGGYTGSNCKKVTCNNFDVCKAVSRASQKMEYNGKSWIPTDYPGGKGWPFGKNHYCSFAVQQLIKAGLPKNLQDCNIHGNGYQIANDGKLEAIGFKVEKNLSGFKPEEIEKICQKHCIIGDVAVMTKGDNKSDYGHAQMYIGDGKWACDVIYNKAYVYPSAGSPSIFMIYRHGCHASTTWFSETSFSMNVNQTDIMVKIVDELIELGIGKEAAIGCAASVYGESSFNPAVLGDNGTSGGLCQWHNNRFTAMKEYCGENWQNNPDKQIEFIGVELQKAEFSGIFKHLKEATTANDGCRIWTEEYEIPKNKKAKTKERQNFIENIRSAYNSFKK